MNDEAPALECSRQLAGTTRDLRCIGDLNLEVGQRDSGVDGRLDGDRVGWRDGRRWLGDTSVAGICGGVVTVDVAQDEETKNHRSDRNDD